MSRVSKGYIGIDPGLRGAIASLHATEEEGAFAFGAVHSMPVQRKRTGKNEVDVSALVELVEALTVEMDLSYCLVERVAAMPGQGVSSMLSLGDSFGSARAVATVTCSRVDYANPRTWKNRLHLTKDKNYSLTLARRYYPAARGFLTRKLDEGRAEAILLARYAALHHDW